jgi:isocitrate dehydrogenase (NAD+)
MAYAVSLIPGDGIGAEVTAAARRVVEATGVAIEWRECDAGAQALARHGVPLPPATLDAIRETKVALKGPLATAIGMGFRSVNVELRQKLDLYANYRPARSITGIPCRYADVDLIVIRENTEGLYSGLEHVVVPGVVESLRIVTEHASRRIVRFAFDLAVKRGRRKVTAVHKANILKLSDGLFLEVARDVARDYPRIEFQEYIVDATAMRLVVDPSAFDVLVMENLFGDILSDLTSGLVGGLGVTPSANIGDDFAVFEAVHGTAPDIAGKGLANPTAVVLSAALLLEHLGEADAARQVEQAVRSVIDAGRSLTRDLGGQATTDQYADALCAAVRSEV